LTKFSIIFISKTKILLLETFFVYEFYSSSPITGFLLAGYIGTTLYTQFRRTLNISLKNFQENGSVGRKPGSGRPKKRTPEVIEEVRQAMEEAPGTSTEHLSQQLGVC
jgi:hypothetical protein